MVQLLILTTLFIVTLISPLPTIVELIAAGVLVIYGTYNFRIKTYFTYILTNPVTGQIYIGRTSGLGEATSILQRRMSNHKYYKLGFVDIEIDRAANGTNSYPANQRSRTTID